MTHQGKRKHTSTLIVLCVVTLSMLGLAFASVPLYRIFCQRTGYGGTPRIAFEESKVMTNRRIKIRFNANMHRDLLWQFKPLQSETEVFVGQNGLAFYQFKNLSNTDLIGIATYNVTPDKAAVYFNKIECFCFEEQLLRANQSVEMPVQFYIDPAFNDDPGLKDVHTITLSYTFFNAKNPNINKILGLPEIKRLKS